MMPATGALNLRIHVTRFVRKWCQALWYLPSGCQSSTFISFDTIEVVMTTNIGSRFGSLFYHSHRYSHQLDKRALDSVKCDFWWTILLILFRPCRYLFAATTYGRLSSQAEWRTKSVSDALFHPADVIAILWSKFTNSLQNRTSKTGWKLWSSDQQAIHSMSLTAGKDVVVSSKDT